MAIARIYRGAFALVRDWPWLILVPIVAELAQHAAEIRLGMYSTGMDVGGTKVRLGFGIVKILTILCALIVAWRLWRFDGDVRRALRPTARLFAGFAIFVSVQILGDLVALGVGRSLLAFAHEPGRSTQLALTAVPMLVWLLASAALFPWYVGLAVEDRAMTLGRTLRAALAGLLATWGLLFAGFLPLMAVHYCLGYAAIRGAPAWPIMIVDAVVVGLLTAALAATYYVIYQRALERTEHDGANTIG